MTQAIVIGYGSIGQRHADILRGLGLQVHVVSRRSADAAVENSFATISDALQHIPEANEAYAVIADETARHSETLKALLAAGHRGPVLVEKPLFATSETALEMTRENIFVGYGMRFLDLVDMLRKRLEGREVYTAELVVGQYLPDWRPGRDYRAGYSAQRAAGGGVLRDLSHEIDLLLWLLGAWKRVAALTGCSGALEIDSEDYAHVLIEGVTYRAATLGLDYLDQNVRRSITIQYDQGTLALDFISGTLVENGTVISKSPPDWNDTYRRQHQAVLSGKSDALCTWSQGLAVVRAFEAVEKAAETGAWQSL